MSTTTRFGWNRVSKKEACAELKRRDILAELTKDAKDNCVACGLKPKRGESVYKASVTHSTGQVERLGHKTCVNRECGVMEAKAAHSVTIAEQRRRRLEPAVVRPDDLPPSTVDDVLKDMEHFFSEFNSRKSVEYERGFRDGALQTWHKIKELMGGQEGRR